MINIGILTSGGDSSGMNTIIYYLVKYSIKKNINIFGIYNGFKGLFKNQIKLLNYKNIFNIIDTGGTILGTSRFNKLKTLIIKKRFINKIKKNINILIIIGGEGSYKGALKLYNNNLPCITIPATIDNDIYNTDYTIGFSTALETIVNYIDKLKFTLIAHKRILILEVMGRKCGDLAKYASICTENNYFIIPEKPFNESKLINKIINNKSPYFIIIITENYLNIKKFANKIENITKIETRYTSLGYIQRSNTPNTFDRILSYRICKYAIKKLIIKNKYGVCIGIKNNKIFHYNINKINKI